MTPKSLLAVFVVALFGGGVAVWAAWSFGIDMWSAYIIYVIGILTQLVGTIVNDIVEDE